MSQSDPRPAEGGFLKIQSAGMAELADALDLGSSGQPCRFKSCCPYEKKLKHLCASAFLLSHSLFYFLSIRHPLIETEAILVPRSSVTWTS